MYGRRASQSTHGKVSTHICAVERNPQTKATIEMKALEYMERAEELKKMLDSAGGAAGASGGTAAMTGKLEDIYWKLPAGSTCCFSFAGESDDKDTEKKKLQGALSGKSLDVWGQSMQHCHGLHHTIPLLRRCHPIREAKRQVERRGWPGGGQGGASRGCHHACAVSSVLHGQAAPVEGHPHVWRTYPPAPPLQPRAHPT